MKNGAEHIISNWSGRSNCLHGHLLLYNGVECRLMKKKYGLKNSFIPVNTPRIYNDEKSYVLKCSGLISLCLKSQINYL